MIINIVMIGIRERRNLLRVKFCDSDESKHYTWSGAYILCSCHYCESTKLYPYDHSKYKY